MNALLGVVLMSQVTLSSEAGDRRVSIDLYDCVSADVLVAQGLLAVENVGSPEGMPATAFLYRGAGSVNMFDRSAEPEEDACTPIGRAVVAATHVTARLPRGCVETESETVSDLTLVEPERPVRRAVGVVIGRAGGREVGRLIATAGRFALLSGGGSVSEKLQRGTVPADVRDHLNGGVVQLVGKAAADGEYIVVDQGAESGESVATSVAGRAIQRRAMSKFVLVGAACP